MDLEKAALCILVAFVVGFIFGRVRAHSASRKIQNSGEALVARVLRRNFHPPDFHLMNHITLRMKDGTTQIDHILVSKFGVFVVETKKYNGWIFANANHKNWTQVFYRQKFKFQNPILQNKRHVRAVRELLDFLPPSAVKSVVVFTGNPEFKTEVPQGVYGLGDLVDHLAELSEEELSLNRVQFCVGRLETARLAISDQTDLEHLESLKRRHGSTT